MVDVIIGVTPEEKLRDEQYKLVAVNALKTMSEILVEMEASGMKEKEMMKFCVWPILEESREKFDKIDKSEEVKVDDFDALFNGNKKTVKTG